MVLAGCAGMRPGRPGAENVVLARQLSQQGLNAIHEGHYADAERRFRDAIAHCPTNTTARYQLANCLWKRNAREEAIAQLSEALELSGRTDVDMLVELGYMYANLDRPEEALQLSDEAIQLGPDRSDAWQLQADCLRQQGRTGAALAAYHRALAHDPTNVDMRLATAEIHQLQRQPARTLAAISHLERQVPLNYQPEQMVLLKSAALRELGRSGEAEELLLAALERGTPTAELLTELARAQTDAGNLSQARRTIQQALALADNQGQDDLRQLLARVAQAPEPQSARRR
jgi:tetratricopeptide (TPR) repeat protein